MGDTGSLFLGGVIAVVALSVKQEVCCCRSSAACS